MHFLATNIGNGQEKILFKIRIMECSVIKEAPGNGKEKLKKRKIFLYIFRKIYLKNIYYMSQ